MTLEHKKGRIRSKHVSYNGAMFGMLKPWTVSLSAESLQKVSIRDWILRVKKSIIVDGADETFTEEAFRKALEEEEQWIAAQKQKEHELRQKQQKEEEEQRMIQMKREMQERKMRSEQQLSTEFTRFQLKEIESAFKVTVSTPDETGGNGNGTNNSNAVSYSVEVVPCCK